MNSGPGVGRPSFPDMLGTGKLFYIFLDFVLSSKKNGEADISLLDYGEQYKARGRPSPPEKLNISFLPFSVNI